MKLYGNLTNRFIECKQEIVPKVGMGATELSWSDRNPYTIIEVISKNKIKVQEDKATHIGEPLTQSWQITPDPKGKIETLIQTKRGWKILKGCTRFIIGPREKYFDYEF